MFPSYVLANLYVKGSLKNFPDGFGLKLKNNIESGTITGLGPITVNENSYPTNKISLKIKDNQVQADQITSSSPITVYVLSEIEIIVKADPLPSGTHKIGFVIHTREAGQLQFSISDDIA